MEKNYLHNKKLKIFILSNDDLTSNTIFANLFSLDNIEITGIAFDKKITKNAQGIFFGALKLLKKITFRYWIFLVYINTSFKIYEKINLFSRKKKSSNQWPISLRKLSQTKKIPVYESLNFSCEDFVSLIKQTNTDLLVIRVSQILKANILSAPNITTWCVHSSLLPSYKGIAGEFHAIKNNEKVIGSSIFEVVEKLDAGQIISQNTLQVDDQKSLFQHIIQNNFIAADLLKAKVNELANNQLKVNLYNEDVKSSYYSWPTKTDLEKFHNRGIALIKWRECWLFFYRCVISIFR